MLYKVVALLVLLPWWQSRRASLLGIGGFVLGLGLYKKSDFSWVLAALVLATVIAFYQELKQVFTPKNLAVFTLCWVLGASIFIWHDLVWPLASFADGNPQHVVWWHPDVLWASLQNRLRLVFQLLDGTSMNLPLGIQPSGTPVGRVFVGAALIALPPGGHRSACAARARTARRFPAVLGAIPPGNSRGHLGQGMRQQEVVIIEHDDKLAADLRQSTVTRGGNMSLHSSPDNLNPWVLLRVLVQDAPHM